MITTREIELFGDLFKRKNIFILDFSKKDFDSFTKESIGIALCEKYRLREYDAFMKFFEQENKAKQVKLVKDLFEYYQHNYNAEYSQDGINPIYKYFSYDKQYSRQYEKCKEVINQLNTNTYTFDLAGTELIEKFSSEYLTKQINLMCKMQTENPTEAIGKAKELIESCCKTILERSNIECNKNWNVSTLARETLNYLDLVPSNIDPSTPGAEAMKAVLGNVSSIATKLAEIRNPYGSGHGKSASYIELEERHAKLAVGSSITFSTFLWDTFEIKNLSKENLEE